MDLPKTHLKSAKGQILILFLLVLVVGLAIVLSVASRTITDIRTTTTSDESNRAYYAAEAGIEEALQQLHGGGTIPPEINTNLQATAKAQATTKDITSTYTNWGSTFIYPENVARDDVAQVVLLRNFNDLSSGSPVPASLNFYWGASPFDVANPDPTPAIEVTVVFWDGSSFGVRKFAFDRHGTRGNNFCTGVADAPTDLEDPISGLRRHFEFSRSIDIVGGDAVGPCDEGIGAGKTPVLARIRLLYNSNPEPVAVTVDSGSLPVQGNVIESTGTTGSGVTRKLQVTRLYPALPALFDYVLFSGSNLSK